MRQALRSGVSWPRRVAGPGSFSRSCDAPVNIIALCPWSPMLPITSRAPATPIRVYAPPVDRPGDEDDGLAVDVIEAMFTLDHSALATISTDGRRSALAKRLERLAKIQSRLTLDRPADYHQQVLRYGEHSLTLLSTGVENFGMSALCSFHMGTPVVGFNVQSLAEVANPQNSASWLPVKLQVVNQVRPRYLRRPTVGAFWKR